MNAGQVEIDPALEGAPVTSEALVECVGASRTFSRGGLEVAAVRSVDCTLAAGMRVALIGPSGSGKSTLLHLLAGLESPTAGALAWPGLGGPPHGRPGAVGVVFQGPSLIPALDVLENVALPLLLAGVAERIAFKRASTALDRLQIGVLSHKLPEEISGGQSQRVAVARVLASRPRMILADEPTGQLDHDTGSRVISILLEVTEELGAALLVSTHDPAVARRLSQRWQMEDGRLTVRELT